MNNFKLILIAITLLAAALRFYKLDINPPGLYWDEAVFGYDAYSITKTGKDHHGNSMPLFFKSFGDWKLPVYHYLLIPSISIFGLNEFAVRFPSAFLGTATIPAFFLLIRRLTKNTNLSLTASVFLAISPWHIQFSRGGFESISGLFFVVMGIIFFLKAIEENSYWPFFYSFTFLALSMYTYHAYRIFTPLLIGAVFIVCHKNLSKNLKKIALSTVLSTLLLLPLLVFSFTSQGKTRALTQSIFKNTNLQTADHDYNQKSKKPLRFLSNYLYEKPVYYLYLASQNYFDHFSPAFLFFQGDKIGRHSQVDMGQIYIFDFIFIAASFFLVSKLNKISLKLMIVWLLLSPIPASIVGPTPHAYRSLQEVIPLTFFSAMGANFIFTNKNVILKLLMFLFITYYFITYLHLLFIHYPRKFAPDWQDGEKKMVKTVSNLQKDFDKILITNVHNVPYIYTLFYNSYDPAKFLTSGGSPDGFDKFTFVRQDFDDIYNKGRILYVSPAWKNVDGQLLETISDSGGNDVYKIWIIGGNN